MDSEFRELILRQLRSLSDKLDAQSKVSEETARVGRETRETVLGVERRLGAVEGHVLSLTARDCEQTSQVADVRVELARLAARAGTEADRSESAAVTATTAADRVSRGKAWRAALQAAGVLLGAALVTATQQCTPTRHPAPDTPPPQAHGGP